MSGLRGDVRKLSQLARSLPSTAVSQRVAARAAPALSELALAAFDAGESPYGDKWPPGRDGRSVDLRESDALRGSLRAVATGTKLRFAMSVRYAKYQIGKRRILPAGGQGIPYSWNLRIRQIAGDEIRASLSKGSG